VFFVRAQREQKTHEFHFAWPARARAAFLITCLRIPPTPFKRGAKTFLPPF
jgi:hypothetical protein